MTSSTDKLTIQALKQHDKIHPKFKATTGARASQNDSPPPQTKAPGESPRRRTTSVVLSEAGGTAESTKNGVNPAKARGMSVFRLVAATRAWQRLAKRKRDQPTPASVPVKYENTYRTEPDEKSRFSPAKVEAILKEVLETRLRHVRYNADQCRRVTTDLVTLIRTRTKTLNLPRYKLVCHVLIMENKGQGSQVASRGLLNADTDSFAAHTYRNSSLVAVAHVHGLYFE